MSTSPSRPEPDASPRPERQPGRWRISPIPIALTALILACAWLPQAAANARLAWTFVGAAAVLASWELALWMIASRRGTNFRVEYAPPLKSHYVQASVQLCIYAYWGSYWPRVLDDAPLILAQFPFIYTLDALLSWSRGRAWRLGFGPVPIVLSVNLFLWFKSDWFAFQFALIAACLLGKEFLRWNRDGKNTHMFNPSAFGLSLFSCVLIATGTTRATWGVEVATTLAFPPHIYLEIFLLGLVVQYLFAVTLMTFAAAATLYAMNQIYTRVTGVYQFVDTNIPIAIFLGLHLLMTDPATSPRTNCGRMIFGSMYGVANFVLFRVLGDFGIPDFYDKLIPVPLLNLCVPWLDRFARCGVVGRFESWQASFNPRKANLVHMGGWAALFATMLTTGFVEGPHEGATIAFWKRAYEQGKPNAGRNLLKLVGSLADRGNAAACNETGVILSEGKLTARDPQLAAFYFSRACELGDVRGCRNLAWLYLASPNSVADEHLGRALAQLEDELDRDADGRSAYLVGMAFEHGKGRASDPARALSLYAQASSRGNLDACKAWLGLRLAGVQGPGDFAAVEGLLQRACDQGDAQSCMLLGSASQSTLVGSTDSAHAKALFERACQLGLSSACDALRRLGE